MDLVGAGEHRLLEYRLYDIHRWGERGPSRMGEGLGGELGRELAGSTGTFRVACPTRIDYI